MSELRIALRDYLALRRALGYRLKQTEWLLGGFVSYLEEHGELQVTTALAIAWATRPAGADPRWWHARLGAVRGFARYLASIDPRTQVPPADLLPAAYHRATPYLYSDADITALLGAAGALSPALRAATYQTLIGLLTVSGIGEALGLARGDVDLDAGVITIRHAKFDRTRLVPLHESSTAALRTYAAERDRLCPGPRADVFFCSSVGTALHRSGIDKTFREITTALGLRTATVRPRVHDLRHGFAVRTLVNWQRSEVSVDRHLATLSGYLGHVAPSGTYWYLSAVPELMELAASRLEMRFGSPR